MNKKIVAISILMLMMCAMAVSVFAQDRTLEYEYNVSITYQTGSGANRKNNTKTYPVWASSQSEAMELAKQACAWDIGSDGNVISCGLPEPTGRSRPR